MSKMKNKVFHLSHRTRLSLYLYNIGCGSAIQKPKKETFFVFGLHSPFTIFVYIEYFLLFCTYKIIISCLRQS